jgi:hypothetical protein
VDMQNASFKVLKCEVIQENLQDTSAEVWLRKTFSGCIADKDMDTGGRQSWVGLSCSCCILVELTIMELLNIK